jgi:hypothetical protein
MLNLQQTCTKLTHLKHPIRTSISINGMMRRTSCEWHKSSAKEKESRVHSRETPIGISKAHHVKFFN